MESASRNRITKSFAGCLLVTTLIFSNNLWAQESSPVPAGSTTTVNQSPAQGGISNSTKVVKEVEKPLVVRGNATHYVGAKEDSDSLTRFMLAGSYKFSPKHSAQIIQYLDKSYIVNEGENEAQFQDTIIRHLYDPGLSAYGISAKWRTEITAPASESSRRNEVLTKPQGMIILSKSFFEERLNFVLQPNFRYYINRYTTTPGPNGGKPLKEMSYGAFQRTDLKFSEKWSATAYLGWLEVQYEDSGYQYEDGSGNDRTLPKHEYFIDASVGYEINKKFSLGLGYLIEKAAETPAGVEVVAFDYEVSNYYLSLTGVF